MNDQIRITNKSDSFKTEYDLEERTATFGEAIIAFGKRVPMSEVTRSLISQMIRAGTSIGANYVEADDADSKKDFKFKIGLCRREAREVKHWLRMVVAAESQLKKDARILWSEAQELNLIFSAIKRKL